MNYCLFTGENYLAKAITLYNSLIETNNKFTLYYFAFDNNTYNYLLKSNYSNIIPIKLSELECEFPELLSVKNERTFQEYYFTCTPTLLLYVFRKFNIKDCTYLDADLYFYSNPQLLHDELGQNDVMITEHRYTEKYDNTSTSGKYCVQFLPFKNNSNSINILNKWHNQCLEWCYHRSENGKWADQGYLNDWTTTYNNIKVLENLGGGVAPWNIQQYNILSADNKVFVNTKTEQQFNLIFYHFHGLRFYKKNIVEIGGYKINKNIIKHIYLPYIKNLIITAKEIKAIDKNIEPLGINYPFREETFFINLIRGLIRGNILIV